MNKNFYVLSEGEIGVKFNGKNGVTGVYWAMSSGIERAYCYNNTDIGLTIYNIKASTCEKLVDIVFDQYADVVVGFSGAHNASMALGREGVKNNVCRQGPALTTGDMNELVSISIIFAGEEDETTVTGACNDNCPECE